MIGFKWHSIGVRVSSRIYITKNESFLLPFLWYFSDQPIPMIIICEVNLQKLGMR